MIDFMAGSRDRRTLIVGGAVVLSLLVIGRGMPAWYRWRADTFESTKATLAEISAAHASVNRRRQVDAAMKRASLLQMEVSPAFLNGSGRAQAVAALASVIADAAATNGLRMGALETAADVVTAGTGDVRQVGVRGEASGDVNAITRFLSGLESGLPLIAVRELSITRGETSPATSGAQSLHVEFVIEGLARFDETERRQ